MQIYQTCNPYLLLKTELYNLLAAPTDLHYLAHITLGRKKDPIHQNIKNPLTPKSIKDPEH